MKWVNETMRFFNLTFDVKDCLICSRRVFNSRGLGEVIYLAENKKAQHPWRWRLTPLPRTGSRPLRPKAPPPLSALQASSFSPWGRAEGTEGPQVTVEPGPLKALIRHCVTWHVLNFGGPIHISGMADLELSNFVYREIVPSLPNDDKLPPKGAWLCSRDQFLPVQLWT